MRVVDLLQNILHKVDLPLLPLAPSHLVLANLRYIELGHKRNGHGNDVETIQTPARCFKPNWPILKRS